MQKFIVLKAMGAGGWQHLGAADAEEPADAIKLVAGTSGGHVAIPFELWLIFEVVATLEVHPVGQMSSLVEEGDQRVDDEIAAETEGMVRPPKR